MTSLLDAQELEEVYREWIASDSNKGEVFTSSDVVRFMLAASGLYDEILSPSARVLEPSCGKGEFLSEITDILLEKIALGQYRPTLDELKRKIVAYDVVKENIRFTKERLYRKLTHHYTQTETLQILDQWLHHGDFLLEHIEGDFTHVVGNPPYIRIEEIPKELLREYRKRFDTMIGRADLYIPFFEKSLALLRQNGRHVFICADRWTKNSYGKKLRGFLAKDYSLLLFADLYGCDAFQSDVATYPAITLISRKPAGKTGKTLVLRQPDLSMENGLRIYRLLENREKQPMGCEFHINVVRGEEPLHLGNAKEMEIVKKLNEKFPTIEDAGCKIHVGAATGNNRVFIVNENLLIERDRKIPVITASEIKTGEIRWSGRYIINTYEDGSLIDIDNYPKLKSYLLQHKDALSKRHIVKNTSKAWYKTIDKVHPDRARREKLLIPDIAFRFLAVYDSGKFHPNNSIYYLLSKSWPLNALKYVLESGIAQLFINVYSTKISNGYRRFQAQHLRKICVPRWEDIPFDTRQRLLLGLEQSTPENMLAITGEIYGLTKEELKILRRINGEEQ